MVMVTVLDDLPCNMRRKPRHQRQRDTSRLPRPRRFPDAFSRSTEVVRFKEFEELVKIVAVTGMSRDV